MESLKLNMEPDFGKIKDSGHCHTGFKGGYYVSFRTMGSTVIGISNDDFGRDSLYRLLDLKSCIKNSDGNIEEFNNILSLDSLENYG